MQISYTKAARKGLRKMPAKDRDALIDKLDAYAATGGGDVKKLTGSRFYRLRRRQCLSDHWRDLGDQWRAILELNGDILVVRIAHRREAYD